MSNWLSINDNTYNILLNIKSKNIFKIIFNFVKNKRKLNIIKYNKNILDKLNITKEDFKIYKTLKKFNEETGLNIDDIDIKELEIKSVYDTDLKLLKKIQFKDLNKLNLSYIDFFDIRILEKFKFEKLKILILNKNNISDIKVLENVNFKELKELDLNYNKISDISVLKNANFKELINLILSINSISDISVLENVDFKKL